MYDKEKEERAMNARYMYTAGTAPFEHNIH